MKEKLKNLITDSMSNVHENLQLSYSEFIDRVVDYLIEHGVTITEEVKQNEIDDRKTKIID